LAAAWISKTDFGGTGRYFATGFSIGNKGYIGTGWDGTPRTDFWEYDPATNAWSQKANVGNASGPGRYAGIGFVINNKGYIGLGANGSFEVKDFWEYDPATNTWTRKLDFAGTARSYAVGFGISDKGYVTTGTGPGGHKKDLWEYDPATNTWTPKTDFGGTARYQATGFTIGAKGYVGTGNDNVHRKDFWEYDPATNTWTPKADFGGTARKEATSFSMTGKGYLGLGNDNSGRKDFWEYDPVANTWTQRVDFAGTARIDAVGFSIGNKGYIGTGYDNSFRKDFWEYNPQPIVTSYTNPNNAANYYNVNDGLWIKKGDSLKNAVAASRLVLDATNVGIGTNTPGKRLDVNGQARIGDHLVFNSASAVINWGNSGNLYFRTNNIQGDNTTGFTDRMVLSNGGNLNVGSVTTGGLDVNGTFRLNDGSQGSGRVLTSNAGGTASWQPLPNNIILSGDAVGYTPFWNGSYWVNSGNIYNANANVGIGTSSPGKKLDVNGNLRIVNNLIFNSASGVINWGIGGNLYFRTNSVGGEENPYNEMMVLTNLGRLGIGTTSPTTKLEVNGNVRINDGSQGAGKVLTSDGTGVANWQTITIPTQIAAGSATGNTAYWNGTAWVNSSNIYNNNANIGIGTTSPAAKLDIAGTLKVTDGTEAAGKVLTSDATGLASWQTITIPTEIGNGNATGNTPYWDGTAWVNSNNIFNNNGNVGIGTASPVSKLDVNGSVRFNTHLTSSGTNAVINYFDGGRLFFRSTPVQGDETTYTEQMVLTGAGNLGIGTTNPLNKLSVVGNANVTGTLTIGNTPSTATLSVDGGIRTRYSGTFGVGFPGAGTQVVNITIAALPAGWDLSNTIVIVTNADGVPAAIQQAKLTSLTNIQVNCNATTGGAARLNWIVFKL
ncbi:MAG TPA: hypothetical protein VHM26_13520, partial [Chitinophagaceae bacterium]|nr:hypothetical protein [Chitinophagaceae bacterium]